ncbi:Capsule polysaccharide biosynthesis protein [Yersinia mollaretii]|uniref:capsular polysaccharide export protein, LipB/KpsS family n=1 Tax=Yersinia mollaretii TaxID=33060 RepID=UPI0005DC7269|nr:capsular biosynthesis protein [Yersinia mollaretii]CNK61327.1 Capsule polysaccharide biosynthesis protein [Yersinia mollaretii]
MKNISILFPDQVHFHDRNFKSLFDTIKKHSIKHTFITDMHHLVATFGDYFSHKEQLSGYYNKISEFSESKLLTLETKGILLFKIYRNEALAYFLSLPEFRDKIPCQLSDTEIFMLMSRTDHEALLLNISATMFWMDFWDEKLSTIKVYTYACIFSGVQIYNRSLLEILKTHATIPLLLEHFFTGNEYYIEEKYEPIPNNTNLTHSNAYNSIQLPINHDEYERNKIKATNKVILSNNKNVIQPKNRQKIKSRGRKVITIIGQVYNDYSIIGTATKYLSSINFYKELILKLLQDDSNYIVFKAHPWERNKTKSKIAPTFESLSKLKESLDIEKRERLFITENFNLSDLINQSEHIITLCSQSAIEAAFLGIKPIQLGNAFYGKKGFTYDYNHIDDFLDDLNKNKLSRVLTLDEYKNLEIFLMKFLESELVSVHKSGISTIERKLKLYPYVKLAKAETPIIDSVLKNEKQITTTFDNSITKTEVNIGKNAILTSNLFKKINVVIANKDKVLFKKFNKLKNNPNSFLSDSKYKLLNLLGKVIFKA